MSQCAALKVLIIGERPRVERGKPGSPGLLARLVMGEDAWPDPRVQRLLAYIALGAIALRRGRTREIRAIAWCAALVVFFWMLSVARLRTPAGFFSLLGIGT